jgi:hypothetical protein
VLVVAFEACVNVVTREELARLARVFARNQIDFLQNAEGAEADVFKIADRSSDKIETAFAGSGNAAWPRFFRLSIRVLNASRWGMTIACAS